MASGSPCYVKSHRSMICQMKMGCDSSITAKRDGKIHPLRYKAVVIISTPSAIAKAEKEQFITNDSVITEAKAVLSNMLKEELTAAMESAKETKESAILQSAIAKAEKEQLVDASIIAEAKAQIPVVAEDELNGGQGEREEKKNPSTVGMIGGFGFGGRMYDGHSSHRRSNRHANPPLSRPKKSNS